MKTVFLNLGIIAQSAFSQNIVKYWAYLYPVIIMVEVAFFIWWAMEIAPVMKEDARRGRGQMMVFAMAAAFVFGATYFLSDILAIAGINVAGDISNPN